MQIAENIAKLNELDVARWVNRARRTFCQCDNLVLSAAQMLTNIGAEINDNTIISDDQE